MKTLLSQLTAPDNHFRWGASGHCHQCGASVFHIQKRCHSERSEEPLNRLQVEFPSDCEALRFAQGDKPRDGGSAQMRTFRRRSEFVLAGLLLFLSCHGFCMAETSLTAAPLPAAAAPSSILPKTAGEIARIRDQELRRDMVERGLKYMLGIQKDGALGDSRPKAVTALFLLACLSSGHQLDDPVYGSAMQAAADWLLKNSPQSFLGGTDEPNEDHALAAIACLELAGTGHNSNRNLALYKKARAALEYSLQAQDKSADAAYGGGWRTDEKTRSDERVLSTWFLLELRGAQLRDESVPKSTIERAKEYIGASQKTAPDAKPDEKGGFSVDAAGLPVRNVTGAGLFTFTLFGDERDADKVRLAKAWLQAHPPRWHGPHFYPAQFFAVRGLQHTQTAAADDPFGPYFKKLVRILHERQDADGSFPFPPGHGQPVLAMGPGYSTALAILILNVDRGFLPLDGNPASAQLQPGRFTSR